jgi:required for meiotic nuclear division protein 1
MTGKARLNRTGILKLIGSALLVQHRVSGRSPLPRSLTRSGTGPDLERLYARVKDEHERRAALRRADRKLAVIAEIASALGDIMDRRRSLRLELIVVGLIAFERATLYQMFAVQPTH